MEFFVKDFYFFLVFVTPSLRDVGRETPRTTPFWPLTVCRGHKTSCSAKKVASRHMTSSGTSDLTNDIISHQGRSDGSSLSCYTCINHECFHSIAFSRGRNDFVGAYKAVNIEPAELMKISLVRASRDISRWSHRGADYCSFGYLAGTVLLFVDFACRLAGTPIRRPAGFYVGSSQALGCGRVKGKRGGLDRDK